MISEEWQELPSLDPKSQHFPLRAKVGEDRLLIFRTAAGWRGVQHVCPHLLLSLTNATLVANGSMLRCPHHNFTFRLSDGKGVNCFGYRLNVYDVTEHDGRLRVRQAATSSAVAAPPAE